MTPGFFLYFSIPPPPVVVIDAPAVEFAAQSTMIGFSAVLHGSIVSFDSMSEISARPRKATLGKAGLRAQSNVLGVGQVSRAAPVLSEDCAFVFPYNRWNWPGSVVSVNIGDPIGDYVASNTQLQQRTKVVRMSSSTVPLTHVVCQLLGDLSAAYRINSMCIVSHNMTKNATFRLRLSADASMTNIRYDSGIQQVWEPSFTDSGPYEEEIDADGKPSADLIEMLRYCGENPRVVRWIVFDEVAARYAWIDFDEPNQPDQFVEIAYIYVGLVVRVHPDQVYGWSISPVSYSRIKRSASGSLWTDIFYRQVVATAQFASQPDSFTLGFWSVISQFLGKKKEFIIAFQPTDLPLAKKFWYTIYCRFRQTPQLENLSTNSSSINLEVEELPG